MKSRGQEKKKEKMQKRGDEKEETKQKEQREGIVKNENGEISKHGIEKLS